MKLEALGDGAFLLTCGDEAEAARKAAALRPLVGACLTDVVLAYRSVGLYFDPRRTSAEGVRNAVLAAPDLVAKASVGKLHQVPVCYELGPDLEAVAAELRLPPEQVIALHASTRFRVFAIGFSPGFPYLGYLPPELAGLGRLPSPRKRVEPGSVGITGRQCCIYPSATPGGWRLIGQTPRLLVEVAAGFFPIRPGDEVQFHPVDRSEFERQRGQRLSDLGPSTLAAG